VAETSAAGFRPYITSHLDVKSTVASRSVGYQRRQKRDKVHQLHVVLFIVLSGTVYDG